MRANLVRVHKVRVCAAGSSVASGVLRPRLYVNADDRFAQGAKRVETGIAELETELVFAFCLESVVAFVSKWSRPGAGVVP